MPLVDFLKPAKKYVLGEVRDGALFAAYAVAQGYDIGSQAKALKLAKAAGEWVLEHGTPTPEKVADALGL